MAVRPRLSLTQRQSLALTPGLQQSIELLLLSATDLTELVQRKLEENPFLERTGPDAEHGSSDADFLAESWSGESDPESWGQDVADSRAAEPPSLEAYLLTEARLAFSNPRELAVAVALIERLDEAGYLTADPEAAAAAAGAPAVLALPVLRRLQGLAPPGLFARSLAECLTLQLADRGLADPAFLKLLDNLPLVAAGQRQRLLRLTGLTEAELDRRLVLLRGLDPKPALAFEPPAAHPVIPDLLVRLDAAGRLQVELNPIALPRVRVDLVGRRTLRPRLKRADERQFYAQRGEEARWLVQALARRGRSLLALGQELVVRQETFFREGFPALKPLTRRTLAKALALSEATVSRLVANKYLSSPQGVLPLARLFSASVGSSGQKASAAAVSSRIAVLVADEPPAAPLSDAALVARLSQEGFAVARRTVAKYREALKIPPAFQRLRGYRLGQSHRPGGGLDSPGGRH